MAEFPQARVYADGAIIPGTPYRVIRMIGAGGMGCVYEVEHIEIERRFVLKSLLDSLATREDLIARMRNEWRALGRLSHENIVEVVFAGMISSGAPYYVMELLVGETLSQRLRRRRRLPSDEASRIAREILLGLSAAHDIDVVHRDIKPANIFITENETVKVLDFGIAKVRDDSVTQMTAHGLAIGTPRYMSPEQVAGDATTSRADIYAVGLLLFEMMAGKGPFDELRGQNEQMLAHLSRQPPALPEYANAPPELDALVRRALAKRPEDRPSSAKEMADALLPFSAERRPHAWDGLGDEPSEASSVNEATSQLPQKSLDSRDVTVERSASMPRLALPSAEQSTALRGEPAPLISHEASTVPAGDEASSATIELSAVAQLDDSLLRDQPTRTSADPLHVGPSLETPPPIEPRTPTPRPVRERRRNRLATSAAIGLGSSALLGLLLFGAPFGVDETSESLQAERAAAGEDLHSERLLVANEGVNGLGEGSTDTLAAFELDEEDEEAAGGDEGGFEEDGGALEMSEVDDSVMDPSGETRRFRRSRGDLPGSGL